MMHYRDYLALYGPPLELPVVGDSAGRVAERKLLQWHDLLIRNRGVSVEARRDEVISVERNVWAPREMPAERSSEVFCSERGTMRRR